jgi:hypothetical protein
VRCAGKAKAKDGQPTPGRHPSAGRSDWLKLPRRGATYYNDPIVDLLILRN